MKQLQYKADHNVPKVNPRSIADWTRLVGESFVHLFMIIPWKTASFEE